MKLTPTLAFLVEYLDLPEAVGDPEARWETFQLKHLNNPSLLAIELKARQVGWSWLAAAEAVASASLEPRIPHIFVSINQEEAAEKIRYAKSIIEALDAEARPKLIKDNAYELEFRNGSRLLSHPCRPVRGKAKAKIYLDEFAHYPNDKEIYQSALPALTKGGFIRIGSSPLGARGTFWEIFTESLRKYPGYIKDSIPWWSVGAMCKDVKTANQLAASMPTEERVAAFGSDRLIQIFENMPLEDFQQEYECAWLDEAVSWIDWELIKRNQVLASQDKLIRFRAKGVDAAFMAINDTMRAVVDGHIEQAFVGGMDIGRTRDTTEIVLLGKNSQVNELPYRLHITLDRIEFEEQKAVASRLLQTLPLIRFLIDRNGIGMQLAENLANVSPAAEGVNFTNETKELWAVEAKLRAQRAEVPLPLDRDLAYQIHSIRRKVTAAKNSVYDTTENEKHHADMFWAWALTIWAGKSDGNMAVVGENPLNGYRG
ncbi:MAG: terminase family protein [Anaerolineales bacterium]|nr:terminase family protein [Anaerolineales bacterium]